MTSADRANTIVARDGSPVRYKTLTVEQVRKWRNWEPGPDGKSGREWGQGERVYAFEDGSVYFVDSGYPLKEPSVDPAEVAGWIEFLDGFWKNWECRTCEA